MKNLYRIILFALFGTLLNCRDRTVNRYDYKLENFNIDNVLKYSDCKSNIDSYGITISSIEDLIVESKKRSTENLNRVLLIYYSEEGDVIRNYKTSLLIYNDDKSNAITFLNSDEKPLNELMLENFQISKFYDYMSKIEVKDYETGYDLMILDFNNTVVTCKYYYLRREDGEKIKALSILKDCAR